MSLKLAGKLFTQRRFLPLFVLFQAGTFNDNVLKNALIALVTYGGMVLFSDAMPEKGLVATAALLFTFPFLVLCTIAGQIADKVDRAVVLKWVKRAEALIMCIAAIGFFTQSTIILAFALFCMGAQSAFFSPTKNAVLPQWLKDKQLITANGILSGFQFFFILLGMVVGIMIVMQGYDRETERFVSGQFAIGPNIVAIVLLVFAVIGVLAAEQLPKAPPPKPDLKVDYNPLTSIFSVLKTSWEHKPVFRPMMGIAWFYGFSNIMILVLPDYVKNVMGYDENVLIIILVASTLSILVGALLCTVLARGREAMMLIAIGIAGVTLFSLDLYINSAPTPRTELGDIAAFKADPAMPRFMLAIIGSSLCAGLYVVPLQAMAQRRAVPDLRARLMSAGAVMLNLAVNVVTFGLIALSFTAMKDQTPFLAIVIISAIVLIYTLYRVFNPSDVKSYADSDEAEK